MKSGDLAIVIVSQHQPLGILSPICNCGLGRIVRLNNKFHHKGLPAWTFDEPYPCYTTGSFIEGAEEAFLRLVSGLPDFEPVLTTLELEQ